MNKAEELYKLRIHAEAVAMEKVHFTKTDRRVNPVKVYPFIYRGGTIPILVSAPHSVRYVKQKKIRVSDEFTGATALLLNKLTNCHTLAVSKLYGGDPNTDKKCFYKENLSLICRENKIKMVIDLHGCSRESDIDISVDCLREVNIEKYNEFKKVLLYSLSAYNYDKVIENAFKLEENSISKYLIQELGIPAFQLTINKKYRVPHQNGQSYSRLISSLLETINILKKTQNS